MKKKIALFITLFVIVLTLTGCGVGGNKKYTCEYTKKSDDDLQVIDKRTMEVNSKGELVKYYVKYGYSNYGKDQEKYKKHCDEMKSVPKNDKVAKNADVVKVDVFCDKDNNYEVYMYAEYDISKLKDAEDYKDIYEMIQNNTDKDGKFKQKEWKKQFFKDYNKGKYTCDFE